MLFRSGCFTTSPPVSRRLDIEVLARFHPDPTTLNVTFSVSMWNAIDPTHIEKRIPTQACLLSFDLNDCRKYVIPSKTLLIFTS